MAAPAAATGCLGPSPDSRTATRMRRIRDRICVRDLDSWLEIRDSIRDSGARDLEVSVTWLCAYLGDLSPLVGAHGASCASLASVGRLRCPDLLWRFRGPNPKLSAPWHLSAARTCRGDPEALTLNCQLLGICRLPGPVVEIQRPSVRGLRQPSRTSKACIGQLSRTPPSTSRSPSTVPTALKRNGTAMLARHAIATCLPSTPSPTRGWRAAQGRKETRGTELLQEVGELESSGRYSWWYGCGCRMQRMQRLSGVSSCAASRSESARAKLGEDARECRAKMRVKMI